MEKLLQWSVENMDPNAPKPDISNLDPNIVDAILGPTDAQLMKDAMTVIQNDESTLEAKEIAFDNFEMLVENMDNANNIENLKLWPIIISLLNSEHETIRLHACWVIGIAVQNNPKAKAHLLLHKDPIEPLSKLLKMLVEDPEPAVRSKSCYAISSLLKHSPSTLALFEANQGFHVFCREITNASHLIESGNSQVNPTTINIIRRIIFLIGALLLEDGDAAEDDHGKFDENYVKKQVGDLDKKVIKSSNDSTCAKVKSCGLLSQIINLAKVEAYKPGSPELVNLDLLEKCLKTVLIYLRQYSHDSPPLDEKDSIALSTFILEVRDKFAGGDILDKDDWEELERRTKELKK